MSIVNKIEQKKKTKAQLEKQKQYTELTIDELKYLIQLMRSCKYFHLAQQFHKNLELMSQCPYFDLMIKFLHYLFHI